MRKPTKDWQHEILECIRNFVKEKRYPPTVREICLKVGLKSSSSVQTYLDRMERDGIIRRDPTKSRSLEILEDRHTSSTVEIPLVKVGAGAPILAEQNVEEILNLPRSFIGSDNQSFMLEVEDDSMIDVGIYHGDFVIVRQQDIAFDGDIVVATAEENNATVKRYFRERDAVRLQPENEEMEPIYVRNVRILGKVIGLYRRIK